MIWFVLGAISIAGLGTTPSRRGRGQAQAGQARSRTILEMRDKQAWTANDNSQYLFIAYTLIDISDKFEQVPLYDACSYFRHAKAPSLQFSLDDIDGLPRIIHNDLSFKDLVLVLYCATEYTVAGRPAGLSLNIYGVVLLAKGNN